MSSSRGLLTLAALGAVALTYACTVITSVETKQCSTDDDCSALGEGFENTVCAPEGVCVVAGSQGCISNAQCTADHDEDPHICPSPGSECVRVLSDDCTRMLGDVSDDNTIIIPFLGPFTGDFGYLGNDSYGPQIEMAYGEFEEFTGGDLVINGVRRPIAMLICDTEAEPDYVARPAAHIINDLHVPMMIGPDISDYVIEISGDAIDTNTMILSYLATSPQLRELPDQGLIWSNWSSSVYEIDPYSKVIGLLEEKIRTDLGLQPTDQIRLAFVHPEGGGGGGVAEQLRMLINFNEKTAAENGDNYKEFIYPEQDDPFDFSPFNAEMIGFQPHIIISTGFEEINGMYGVVEDGLAAAPVRPIWVTSQAWGDDPVPYEVIGDDEDRRKRLIGLAPAPPDPGEEPFASFYLKFTNTFGGNEPFDEEVYDAFYLALYAMQASQNFPGGFSGNTIAQGMAKVVPPSPLKVNVGPTDLTDALAALSSPGGSIDVKGVSGPLDFNVEFGDVGSNYVFFCVTRDDMGAPVPDYSGGYLYYDITTGDLSGPLVCPGDR